MNQQFPSLVVTLVNLFISFFLQESHWCIEQSGQLPDFDRRVVFDTSGLNQPSWSGNLSLLNSLSIW
jgi:hypothetical protein